MSAPARSPHGNTPSVPRARTPEEIAAFEAMFRAHYADVCAYARRFVRSPAVAEELAQDVFTRIWERLDSLDPARNERSYLFTAAKRAALNYLTREGLAARYVAQQDGAEPATEFSAADALEDAELIARVHAAAEQLPPQAKAVWQLRREANMSYAEIAQELGLSVKTVERHMGRAFRGLRASLAGYLAIALVAVLSA
jgi:RNA polymerase sigma-70 factor (ECF subfamily)